MRAPLRTIIDIDQATHNFSVHEGWLGYSCKLKCGHEKNIRRDDIIVGKTRARCEECSRIEQDKTLAILYGGVEFRE